MHIEMKDRNQEPYFITKKYPISQSDEEKILVKLVDNQMEFVTDIMQKAKKASYILR